MLVLCVCGMDFQKGKGGGGGVMVKDKWETGKHKLKIQLFIRYSSVIDLYGNIIEESYL